MWVRKVHANLRPMNIYNANVAGFEFTLLLPDCSSDPARHHNWEIYGPNGQESLGKVDVDSALTLATLWVVKSLQTALKLTGFGVIATEEG